MMKRFTQDADHIFLACGATDFRKQIPGLVAMVQMQFCLDPYEKQYVFLLMHLQKKFPPCCCFGITPSIAEGGIIFTTSFFDAMQINF